MLLLETFIVSTCACQIERQRFVPVAYRPHTLLLRSGTSEQQFNPFRAPLRMHFRGLPMWPTARLRPV